MRKERIDWPNGAKLALPIVVNVEEGSEMTVARGDRGMEPVDELGIHVQSPIRNYGNESDYLYGTKLLVDLVGPARARRILFTAGLIDAVEAHRIGLVDLLDGAAIALAETTAGNSARSVRRPRRWRGASSTASRRTIPRRARCSPTPSPCLISMKA